MNYPEMINKIREDRVSETKDFVEHEKMRTHLQRSALKNQQLISNQKCSACIQDMEEQQELTDHQSKSLKKNPRYAIPHSCVAKLSDVNQQANFRSRSNNVKTDQDFNWYRKVSKYDIDANQVDWVDLMREKERQNRKNVGDRKREQGGVKEKINQNAVVGKMMKIN